MSKHAKKAYRRLIKFEKNKHTHPKNSKSCNHDKNKAFLSSGYNGYNPKKHICNHCNLCNYFDHGYIGYNGYNY